MDDMPYARLRINQDELKCRNGCDFYGNAQFDGMCSKCFRERNDKKKKSLSISMTSVDQIQPTLTSNNSSSSLSASPNEQSARTPNKRLDGGTYETLFKNRSLSTVFKERLQSNASLKNKSPKKQQPDEEHTHIRSYVVDSVEAELLQQLRQMDMSDGGKRKFRNDIQRLDNAIRNYLNKNKCEKNIDELAELVQNFYIRFMEILQHDERFQLANADERERIMDFFEKMIMTKNHKFLFSPYFTNDEEKDVRIQRRIRQLSWITAKHLQCSIDEVNAESRELVYCAINELVSIDSHHSPQEKLLCTVRCCRYIFELLKFSVNGPASADEFLPALIFVVLKANPVRLHSNINYVKRFTNEPRILSGESGYYFTNLCCAIEFIENLNHESLSMDEQEFKQLMSGEKVINSPWESALLACENLHLISENLRRMSTLKKKNGIITEGMNQFDIDLNEFMLEVNDKIDAVLSRTPLTILPIQTPQRFLNQVCIGRALTQKTDDLDPGMQYRSNLLTSMISNENIKDDTLNLAEKLNTLSTISTTAVAAVAALGDDSATRSLAVSPLAHTLTLKDTRCLNKDDGLLLENMHFDSPLLNLSPQDIFSHSDDECSDSLDELQICSAYRGNLENVNYDFDMFDRSVDNSATEDFPAVTSSPLTVDGMDAATSRSNDSRRSLLDQDSPPHSLLQPPLLNTIVPDYHGFSNFNIPSISCHTGDCSITPDKKKN